LEAANARVQGGAALEGKAPLKEGALGDALALAGSAVLQLFASNEHRYALGRDGDGIARLRILASTSCAILGLEGTETDQLHAACSRQFVRNGFEEGVYESLGYRFGLASLLGQCINEFSAIHIGSFSVPSCWFAPGV